MGADTDDAERMNGVLLPSPETVRRYGLDRIEWIMMLESQGSVCGVCGKVPPSGRLFTDHEHVRGWKKLPPEERRKYVRGLVCYICNRFVLNYRVSAELMRQAAGYLDRYEAGKP